MRSIQSSDRITPTLLVIYIVLIIKNFFVESLTSSQRSEPLQSSTVMTRVSSLNEKAIKTKPLDIVFLWPPARRASNSPISGKAPDSPEDYVAYLYQDLGAG